MNATEYRKKGLRRRWSTTVLGPASPDTNKATLVQRGFTIVELLIVIVVIAILAAITVVAYTGVQNRAEETKLQSDLRQAGSLIAIDHATHGAYPEDEEDVADGEGLSPSNGTRFEYTSDGDSYCLSATSETRDVRGFHISSETGRVQEGVCDGHEGPSLGDVDGGLSIVSWDQISAGRWHTCAVAGGEAYCWGAGNDGRLGNGDTANRTTPIQVTGLSNVTAISAGGSHTCAVANGDAYCWGSGLQGRLGNGGTDGQAVPIQVAGLSGVTSISAGIHHTCAVAGGDAYCWGRGTYGVLGNGDTAPRDTPALVASLNGVTSISAGTASSCAIAGGDAYCWGWGNNGRLGNGDTVQRASPVQVSGISNVTSISAADVNACAVAGDNAYCWGAGVASPAMVSDISGVTSISVGYVHRCAISDSDAYCWGTGSSRQLGNGDTASQSAPVRVSETSS
ncbi:prepilin-type N-terminal cleavage/methylation domain-containing protein [Nesterenkonia muleiensis]|uniref:prepilin-type N-terminal cleavage/methylation domain-containing protein n=1 Tax=Nesterenkonia muleiensis TaxID=2282648 RepID=UPI000E73B3EF|nr:prepilin-type N-terminal cleavage/methylation domain-containing protein [Nesterenkonia muleiensis]